MCANDTESKQRIERHRKMRADKSFQTIEVSKAIDSIAVGSDSVVLLECLSNLLANEMFSNNTAAYSVSSLLQQIRHLQSHCQHLIVVSNEIFSDGICYDLSTTQYLSDLGYPASRTVPHCQRNLWSGMRYSNFLSERRSYMSLLRSFCIAFGMYSKIPMPKFEWNPKDMRYTMCFFPLVSIPIALLVLLWFYFCQWLHIHSFLFACVIATILYW